MAATSSLDWLFLLGGGFVGLIGLALVLLAIFRDRSRGRRRCPKCWYDMAGAPGLKCPECACDAKTEKRLYRTRRRWKRAALGAIVVLLAYCIAEVPTYKRGWAALVPTTILAMFAPAEDQTRSGAFGFAGLAPAGRVTILSGGVMVPAGPAPPAPPSATISQQLTDEFWNRLRLRQTSGWQARRFFHRYFQNHPVDFSDYVSVPERWPVGAPIFAKVGAVTVGSMAGIGIDTVATRVGSGTEAYGPGAGRIGAVAAAAEEIDVELRLQYLSQVLHRSTFRIPIAITGTVATFLDQRVDTAANTLVREAIQPRLIWDETGPLLMVNDRSNNEAWKRIEFGVAYRVDLLLGDEVLGSGSGAAEWGRPVWKDWDEIRFAWVEGGRQRAAAAPDQIRVVIRGDPAAAGQTFMTSPFGKTPECWAGQLEVPSAAGSKNHRP